MAQFRGARYAPRKPREWFVNEFSATIAGTVAVGVQETVLLEELDHPGTNEDFGPGSIEGLRITICGETGTTSLLVPPSIVVGILPQGTTVPTVNTDATKRQSQDRIWLVGKAKLAPAAMAGSAARGAWIYEASPKTSRKMSKGDQLFVVAVNRDGTTWANPHSYAWSVEAYVAEG